MAKFEYRIDLDERGSYRAHVENQKTGKIVFTVSNEITDEIENEDGELETITHDGELWIVEDGFMKHTEDMDGLEEYLKDMKVIKSNDTIVFVG